jgi:phosphohistidine phosphatase SixA
MNRRLAAGLIAALLGCGAPADAAPLSGPALVDALQRGGYVIVMRHASSPIALPDAKTAELDNTGHERQLDAAGKESARAMGTALKALHIPIGKVWSSPTYRARETVRIAGLPAPETAAPLGDAGKGMQARVEEARAGYLRGKSETPPRGGTDTIVVTHGPNMAAAFGKEAAGLTDGEAMVFRPNGQGQAEFVARVRIGDWPKLAGQH